MSRTAPARPGRFLLLALAAAACSPDRTEPAAGPAPPAPVTADTVTAPEPSPEFSPAPWDAARERGAAWRGIGQEPGWTVEIHPGDRIVYVGDYGETNVTAPAPEPVRRGTATAWHATTPDADLRVVFEELPCADVMSGEEMPFTVTVTVNGQELHGCGRRL